MKIICFPFLLIAAVGFLLSLTAHLMALAGQPLPGPVWLLHIGIFLVWIPTIVISNRKLRNVPRANHWKVILADCPVWMRRAISVVFVYALINFLLFMATTVGHPKPKGTAPPAVVRGFSGHWMVFYGVAFVVLYSNVKSPISGPGVKNSKRQQQ